MINHVVFYRLNQDVDDQRLEGMVRTTRSLLLKIPEILSVHSGRNVNSESEWHFFYSIEIESLGKLAMTIDDPQFLKFMATVIKPNTIDEFVFDFEMDPSKDLRYS